MRQTPHLHERHLLEAVRQKVISHEQYEGILAVVRTMTHAEGNDAPDLGWISVLQAGAAGAAVGFPGIYLLDRMRHFSPAEFAGWCLLGAIVSFAGGALLRQWRSAAIASGVLLAAGVAFTWGLFSGAYAEMVHATLGDTWAYRLSSDDARRGLNALLVGDLGLIAVAALVAKRFKAPVAMVPATMAFVHLVVEGAHRFVWPYDLSMSDRESAPWIAAAGGVALLVARLVDRKDRGREDSAFWIHLVGLLAIGFAFTIRIGHNAEEWIVWSFAALAVIGLGVWWNRRVYLACGSTAWLFWPAMGFMRGSDAEMVIGAFVFSSVTLALFATWLRGRWARLAASDPERTALRTVWG